jgi:hypothetical protein
MITKYKEGFRELSEFGTMRILKYIDGSWTIIDRIKNVKKYTSPINEKWWQCLRGTFEFNYATEEEWTKAAVERARELKADKVQYYDSDVEFDTYRKCTVWDYATEKKYDR